MSTGTVLEGLWEDVAQEGERLRGHYVRVEIVDAKVPATSRPLYETLTAEEHARAILEWGHNRRPRNAPPLSDEAISREAIYFGED